MFTARTAVVPFKRNGLGLALCENSWFILTELPWFFWFGFTAGAKKAQHWKQSPGQKWNLSKAPDMFIVLQHSVIECSLIGGVLDHQWYQVFKKFLILSKQERRKVMKMQSFPLKSAYATTSGVVVMRTHLF